MNSQASSLIRMGNVSYLNSVPYRAFADLPWLIYSEHTPADCSCLLADGDLDLGLVPVAEFFGHEEYGMLEWGIVGCGAVRSVMLLSKCVLDEIDTIFVDSESRSSVALLRVLLAARLGSLYRHINFVKRSIDRVDIELGEKNALLVIGDKALLMQSEFLYAVDLSEWWKRETGLPFVFAAWAGRTSLLTKEHRASLESSLRHSIDHRDLSARIWAREHGIDENFAAKYITENVFHFIDHAALKGMQEFLKRGVDLGLFPQSMKNKDLHLESLV